MNRRAEPAANKQSHVLSASGCAKDRPGGVADFQLEEVIHQHRTCAGVFLAASLAFFVFAFGAAAVHASEKVVFRSFSVAVASPLASVAVALVAARRFQKSQAEDAPREDFSVRKARAKRS